MKTIPRKNIHDALGRSIRDLRISVTDRCNFRCVYCMPREIFGPGYEFLPRKDLLSLEEIFRIVKVFSIVGVRKIRITGGEPLIRRNLEHLIEMLGNIENIEDISMTTNASLLSASRARSLREAGLKRITVSLDAIDDPTFGAINDVDYPVSKVLEGIENAKSAGFSEIKINAVIKRGINEHAVLPLAEHFRNTGCIVRFIEFMDVGESNGWEMENVVSMKDLLEIINSKHPIVPLDPNYRGEVAKRWRYLDNSGEIGFITSVTSAFCGDCSRARLSAVGKVYTCLFASDGTDLRSLLRSGISDHELLKKVSQIWGERSDRYSEMREQLSSTGQVQQKVEMSYIGG